MTSAILRCQKLRKSFDGNVALDDITLSVEAGAIVAIVGPNGAGKTTLINIITSLMRPDHGDVFFREQRLTGLPAHRVARRGIARTFQDVRLVRGLSVLHNVMLARPHQVGEYVWRSLARIGVRAAERENRDASMKLLESVGLAAHRDIPAGDLSYGQQKLLTLSCCLATDAALLLLDEPVAGVADDLTDQVLSQIRTLRSTGRSIVFIEHNLDAVRRLADRIIVLDRGKVIANGPAEEVLSAPAILDAYVA